MEPKTLIGARLTAEDVATLDRLCLAWNLESRSEALREMIHRSSELPPSGEEVLKLPAALLAELEEMVVNTWADSLSEALTLSVTRGMSGLAEDVKLRSETSRARAEELQRKRLARKTLRATGERFLGEGE